MSVNKWNSENKQYLIQVLVSQSQNKFSLFSLTWNLVDPTFDISDNTVDSFTGNNSDVNFTLSSISSNSVSLNYK
mgnify:CR=1 FL=1